MTRTSRTEFAIVVMASRSASYLVRYFDAASNAMGERSVEAETEAAARSIIERDGAVVMSIVVPSGSSWLGVRRARGSSPAAAGEIALLCRELRAMLGAGLSVVEALDALAVAGSTGVIRKTPAQALLDRLREGRSLSAAMRDVGGFPSLLVASVQSSERTSNLAEALDAYLRFDDLMAGLRRRVVSAALYPTIVVTLGAGVAVFLLMVVIPRFATLYGELKSGAGGTTQALIQTSLVLRENPWIVPAVVLSLLAAIIYLARRERWKLTLRWIVDAMPWLRQQVSHFDLARLYESLALLVQGGYTLHEALGMSASASAEGRVTKQVQSAQEAVARGVSVSVALSGAGLTDAFSERLLRAGERGGSFHRVLRAVADRHSRAFETFVERSTRVVEPLLLLLVALVVGGMVVTLYMPVFDIAASVQ